MNERLPYEEALASQWDDLTLPNENMAWEDMKRRLKKDDDDKGFLPFWLNGCAVWGLILLLLVGLGWGTYHYIQKDKTDKPETAKQQYLNQINKPENSIKQKESNENNRLTQQETDKINKPEKSINQDPNRINKNEVENNIKKNEGNKNIRLTQKETNSVQSKPVKNNTFSGTENTAKIRVAKNKTKIDNEEPNIKRSKKFSNKSKKISNNQKTAFRNNKKKNKKSTDDEWQGDNAKIIKDNGKINVRVIAPGTENENTGEVKLKDSAKQTNKDTIAKKIDKPTDTSSTVSKPPKEKKNKISFLAGIGEQQQIPLNGQTSTPYNALGRKGSWLDYIPSVYVRMKKNEKWFIEGAYKYGAPQYNKEFLYQQKIVPDTGVSPPFTNITSSNLKKTYYHQLPLSFNYYIAPNWSIGAGVQWNKFVGAIRAVNINRKNNSTQQDSIISDFVGIDKKDTSNVFKRNYFSGIVETQYQWKRFTFGAKYTFGLQPYITFTLPGGAQQQLRSSALNVFIKYELWRSKKD